MKDTFRILMESYKLHKVYNRLHRKGLLNKRYTLSEIFEGVKKMEVLNNG